MQISVSFSSRVFGTVAASVRIRQKKRPARAWYSHSRCLSGHGCDAQLVVDLPLRYSNGARLCVRRSYKF